MNANTGTMGLRISGELIIITSNNLDFSETSPQLMKPDVSCMVSKGNDSLIIIKPFHNRFKSPLQMFIA
jgi:hypothetical protein